VAGDAVQQADPVERSAAATTRFTPIRTARVCERRTSYTRDMSFPWLECTPSTTDGHERRVRVATEELTHRAALFYRLGVPAEVATARLSARVAWEYDPPSKRGHHARPEALSDGAIAVLVAATYARRPG
jgi:hypothetical protein